MNKPLIVMVVGHESSGTRLATRILMACGCHGSDTHGQPWDHERPTASPAVWRRSFPHQGSWPVLKDLIPNDFDASVVVCRRDWRCSALSQVAAGHVKTVEQALANIRRAEETIAAQTAGLACPWVALQYEQLCSTPIPTAAWIASQLGLEPPVRLPDILNANSKYSNDHDIKEDSR